MLGVSQPAWARMTTGTSYWSGGKAWLPRRKTSPYGASLHEDVSVDGHGLEAVSAGKGEDGLRSGRRARRTLRCVLLGPHPLIRVPRAPCRFLTPAWETCQGAAPRLLCSFPTLHIITALTSSIISPQAAGDKQPLLMPPWGPPGVDSVSRADNWPTHTWHSLAPSQGR